jgi:hypothetical protein
MMQETGHVASDTSPIDYMCEVKFYSPCCSCKIRDNSTFCENPTLILKNDIAL